jgi:probable rRNA maturation factor
MSKLNKTVTKRTPAGLSLSVQYAIDTPLLPRWKIRRWVQRAIDAAHQDGIVSFTRVQLGLRLVGLAEGRQLNANYRNKDYATNVLTFEYGVQPDGTAAGDIVLCVPVLKREAKEQRKELLCHAAHLVIHGTLHALGYDHLKSRDAKHMEYLEIGILAQLGIENPYLIHASPGRV